MTWQMASKHKFSAYLDRIVKFRGHECPALYAEEVGQAHIRARFRSGDGAFINAIAFRALNRPLGQALLQNRGRSMHAAGTLALDRWNGNERVQLRLIDVASDDPSLR